MTLVHSILLTVAILTPLIPIVMGIKRRNGILFIYLLSSFLSDAINVTYRFFFHANLYWLINIFAIVELICISLYYDSKIFKKPYFIYAAIVILICIYILTLPERSFLKFNEIGIGIFQFVYIVFAVAGLFYILKEQRELFLEKSSFFWVNVAFLIYASSNVLLFLSSDYMIKTNKPLFDNIWIFVFLPIQILKNLFLAMSARKKTSDIVLAGAVVV